MPDEKKTEIPIDPAALMESAFLFGIGMLEVTKEKTQGLANDLIDRGKLSQSDAKKAADKLGEMAAEQQDNLRKTVAQETDKVLKTSGVATHEEIADLKAEIAELKALIAGTKSTEATE